MSKFFFLKNISVSYPIVPAILGILPVVERQDEDGQEDERTHSCPAYLGEHHRLRPDHQLDVLGEVVDPVNPHDGDQLPDSNPEDSEASSICVHQIEDILTIGGDTGETQEEAAETTNSSDLDLVTPECWSSIVDCSEHCLQQSKLGVDAQEEDHHEEEDGPEPGQWQRAQCFRIRDEC